VAHSGAALLAQSDFLLRPDMASFVTPGPMPRPPAARNGHALEAGYSGALRRIAALPPPNFGNRAGAQTGPNSALVTGAGRDS
jgi:hypothetical protein